MLEREYKGLQLVILISIKEWGNNIIYLTHRGDNEIKSKIEKIYIGRSRISWWGEIATK